jgi:hypothetical protein
MSYICYLGGFIEPSKSLGEKYEPSEKFRGQKQTLFFNKLMAVCIILMQTDAEAGHLFLKKRRS